MNWKCIKKLILTGVLAGSAMLMTAGCSRSTINYQIAESIGTLGKYENGEPVETPQMKEARLQKEADAAKEAALVAKLNEAKRLADGYFYEEAIALLSAIEGEEAMDKRIPEAIEQYQSTMEHLQVYEGDYSHLCFLGLIEDTARAFDGDSRSQTYASSRLTTKEFRAILNSLYQNGYVLVDIHDVANEETDDRGITTVEMQKLRLPAGKKPILISQDNLNYKDVTNGDGIATRLVLDDDGKVKALYTDEEGHDLKGDYDLIPILDSFVEEHPDFSYRGARGIVSVSGIEGVFGYEIRDTTVADHEENRSAVRSIAQALRESGWQIAGTGYNYTYINSLNAETLKEELDLWSAEVGELTGTSDILFYPYGAEVDYPGEMLDLLIENGYIYLCGLCTDADYLDSGEGYMRQTRRFIDGYSLMNAPDYFRSFFDTAAILDSDRY